MSEDIESVTPLAEADRRFQLASQFEEAGEYESALEECEAAISVARSFLADAYNLQGIVLEGLERPEEAIDAYKKALRADSGLTEAADNLNALEDELGFEPRLVSIVRLANTLEAQIVQSTLEAEGVHSVLADQDSLTGEVSLQVMESEIADALDILGLEPEDMPADESEEE